MNTPPFDDPSAAVGAPLGAKNRVLRKIWIAAKAAPTLFLCAVMWRAVVAAILLFGSGIARAQAAPEAVHGADAIFASPDAAIVWAVLKQPAGDKAAVWLRIINSTRKFSHVAVDGVDPFSKKRERIAAGMKLESDARIASDRDTFSDLPSREVHFFRTEGELRNNTPTLTVYYLGVPDTTPEFSTRAAMDEYFNTVRLTAHKAEPKR